MKAIIFTIASGLCFGALSSCKLADQDGQLAGSELVDTPERLDDSPPYTFQETKSNENDKLRNYRNGLSQETNLAFRSYYRDMFESVWFAGDGYSVNLSLESVQGVAVREAKRRFSPYDQNQLYRGLSQEVLALKQAEKDLAVKVKAKKEEIERYLASYQSRTSLGALADRAHPFIDTSSEGYWEGRESAARQSSRHQRMSQEKLALSSELEAVKRRTKVLQGVVLGLGKS